MREQPGHASLAGAVVARQCKSGPGRGRVQNARPPSWKTHPSLVLQALAAPARVVKAKGVAGHRLSFIRYILDDAAAATVLALDRDGPAIYNITDDEPAPCRVWLPELAKIVGAKPPQHFPRLIAQLFAGDVAVIMATESRGASNAKAKKEFGWTLRYPSWRQGFAAAYGPDPLKTAA
jgi:nucleoside-diphosphate-sugar epimerase